MGNNGNSGYHHWAMNKDSNSTVTGQSTDWADILKEVSDTELEMRLILKNAVELNETSSEMAPVLNGIFLNWMNLELVSLISRLGIQTGELNKKIDDFILETQQVINILKQV